MGVNSVDGPDRAVQARVYAAPAPLLRTPEAAKRPKEEQVQPVDLAAKTGPAPAITQASSTRISVDKESKRIVTQILDENNEVIRQTPPKELLELSARFKKLQGLLFDERA